MKKIISSVVCFLMASLTSFASSAEEDFEKADEFFKSENYGQAVEFCRKAAEQGHAEAQCDLGNCYYNGEGVEKDYDEAEKWFRKAAKQGNKDAARALETLTFEKRIR